MKSVRFALALAGAMTGQHVQAISLDDIQLWTGGGTNRAALVIEWNSPEVFNYSSVPAPIADKTLVWGYRFNGTATGGQMTRAVAGADPKLYVMAMVDSYGTFVEAIGYNLSGNGTLGVTDGTTTNIFTNRFLITATVDPDAAAPLNRGDLFWSGYLGPNWQTWTELGDAGGFEQSPERGSSAFWDTATGVQGQWEFAMNGLDQLTLTNGSWIGFSVAAAGYDSDPADPAYAAYNNDEQAPPSPDGTYVAYVNHTNNFAVQIVSSTNLDAGSPYNDPAAVLNRPTLQFFDPMDGGTTDRVSIINPPYNAAPDGSDAVAVIEGGGQITVQLGAKVYADPSHPYGVDLILYGNSFFEYLSNLSGTISDATDLGAVTITNSTIFGHPAVVSVSQDGTNWFTFPTTPYLFPANAYRWDDPNGAWTQEEMNPTKPLNPLIYTNDFAGVTVAGTLDQFIGASGGTGYSLSGSGLPWIQYVRLEPGAGNVAVIDAIATVNPVVVGDALSVAPDNLAAGITNLSFQSPSAPSQNQISINFESVNEMARISTVSLSDFSSFAPVVGNVCSAYQIQARPVTGTNAVTATADLGLYAGGQYSGNGSDLRVWEWNATNWMSQTFGFNATNNEVVVGGVSNFSAFVISQIVPPRLAIQTLTNGFAFQFTPVPNCPESLERSTDFTNWAPIATFTPTNAQPVTLPDTHAPAGKAFYRVSVQVP